MNFLAILNRDGGTLKTTDLDAFGDRMRTILGDAGHTVEIEIVEGKELEAALEKAARRRNIDVVIAGGGDGTISAAAAALSGRKKALAILPAGTMNLFARGLGIPLGLEDAVACFANGKIVKVDLASANDRIFVHQFSVGMHPKLVQARDKMAFASRLGKIRASVHAAFRIIKRPPRMRAKLVMKDTEIEVTATSIGISNNLFGEGHMPYAEMPNRGELGIYVTRTSRADGLARFAFNMALGRWKQNREVEIHTSDEVVLTLKPGRLKCAIDGELCELTARTRIVSLPGALNVLVAKG